jgi:glycosyltransferase involved in cell wall biosynthesis
MSWVYGKLAFFKPKAATANRPPVSVVIAARNEADNLQENLPAILEQEYPDFEVIVVNDKSWDNTIDVLYAFREKYERLKVVNIPFDDEYDGGKKYAITLGIKGAAHERLVFTDADCRPASRNWLSKIASEIARDDAIILGYSPYAKMNGLLNKLIRFDNFNTALNYLGLALCGVPYMGVGRNLSYTKSDFFAVGGFKSHYRLLSGDDDLFINRIAEPERTAVCLDKDAVVETLPETSWKAYWRQKRRHLTTGVHYRAFHRLILSLHPITLILFWVSALSLIFLAHWQLIALGAIAARLLLQFLIFSRSTRWLGQSDLIIFAPVLEPAVVMLTAIIHMVNATSNKVTWKT